MASVSYTSRRAQLEEYFDRTAVDAWARITSDAPVGRIRATVRAGRDRMRETLLSYLPDDLTGQRVLDAGCGTGALAVAAARRGAEVVAVDISPTLIELARERMEADPELNQLSRGQVEFVVGDMLHPRFGEFHWVVAMDSFIHYQPGDVVELALQLASRAGRGLAFTFAPSSPLLTVMHTVGKAFPRGNRSPDIVPISERHLKDLLLAHPAIDDLQIGRSERIKSGFYTSQTLELVRA